VAALWGTTARGPVYARFWLSTSLAALGEFAEAIACAEEAMAIAGAAQHPWSQVLADIGIASVWVTRGDAERATLAAERAVTASREWDIIHWHPTAVALLGLARLLSRRVEEGRRLLHQALKQEVAMRGMPASRLLWRTSEGELLGGDLDEAHALAEGALATCQERRERPTEASSLLVLGKVAARRDPPAHAEDHYRDALSLAEELGMRPLAAHCHLGLGKLYRRTGKRRQEAQEHLTIATTMYRGMDMRFWLEKAEAELKELA
jgi:tetratricopeptide (TPR) repeat protein